MFFKEELNVDVILEVKKFVKDISGEFLVLALVKLKLSVVG